MSQGLVAFAAFELLFRNRSPQFIDDLGRLAGDLLDWVLQMLSPEAQPRLASEGGIAGHDVHLSVVEEECSLRLADPTVNQASSTIPILA